MIFAPKFPLSFDDTDGFQNVENLKELVLFHLKNLLMTNRGEKTHFLCKLRLLRTFLFSKYFSFTLFLLFAPKFL